MHLEHFQDQVILRWSLSLEPGWYKDISDHKVCLSICTDVWMEMGRSTGLSHNVAPLIKSHEAALCASQDRALEAARNEKLDDIRINAREAEVKNKSKPCSRKGEAAGSDETQIKRERCQI